MRPSKVFLCLVLVATRSAGQDMPLSQVLMPGEGWHSVAGITGAVALATNDRGTVFAAERATGHIVAIGADGTLRTLATVPGVRSLAVGTDGVVYAGQSDGQTLRKIAPSGNQSIVAKGFATDAVVASPGGGFYGTIGAERAVYRIERDAKKRSVAGGIECPACLALWGDRGTLVVGDSAGKHLWVFRIEADGSLSAGEPYYALRTRPKEASGVLALTMDAAGRLFAATREGVQVFDTTGRLSGVVLAPERSPVTAIAFGGAAMDRLFTVCSGTVYYRKTLIRGAVGAAATP
jgi:gluconolactonase